MTRRWIGTAITLTAVAAVGPLHADDVAAEWANAPVTLNATSEAPAVAPAPGAAPNDANLPAPLAAEPVAEQEFLPLGPAPKSDDPNTAKPADTNAGLSWGLQTVMALGVVIGLIYLVRAVLRRMHGLSGPSSSNTALVEVLARCPVAARTHVLLLRINDRVIVAGQTQAGLNTLAELDDPDEVAGLVARVDASRPTSITSGFNKLLSQFDRGHQTPVTDEGADDAEHMVDRARSDVSSLIGRIRSFSSRDQGGDRP